MSARSVLLTLALCALGLFAGCQKLDIASSRASQAGAPAREEVTLRAQKPAGVPVHPEPGSGAVSARIPDGARVHVLERRDNGRWLLVRDAQGQSGWITKRYIASAPSARPSPSAASRGNGISSASPWSSRSQCETVVGRGGREPRAAGRARLAAWNLRWFPDGAPGLTAAKDGGTDLEWLACLLVFLDADVVALSEIKAHARAKAMLDRVLARAAALSGAEWRVRIDDCRPEAAQHVALVWNARKLTAQSFTQHAELNPRGSACADQLRPGLGGYFRFAGGLDLEIVAVHFKSGQSARDLELRTRSLGALSAVNATAASKHRDADVIVLGDFNTMGCSKCATSTTAADELAAFDALLQNLPVPFRRARSEPACSHYFQGRASLLDLAVVPVAMRELDSGASVRVSGLCAELGCGSLPGAPPPAHARLSDHCPILVDLVDRDLDE